MPHRFGLASGSALAALCAVATATHAQVEVDGRGGLATGVAIEVPAYHDLAPRIALSYRSARSVGLAGVGWELDAGSQITRRSSTGGISRMEPADVFTLDGAELIGCTTGSVSPSCQTGAVVEGSAQNFYATRVESFRRIRRDPAGGAWRVWDRDGTVSDYATVDGGASFQLRTVTDRFGNHADYAWTCASLACELDTVRYGATPSAQGTEVVFFREARPDPWSTRGPAGPEAHRERLRSVVVRQAGGLVRAYRLGYAPSLETGRSILVSVQQFPRDATVTVDGVVAAGPTPPLPPRTFTTASTATAGDFALVAETSSPALFTIAGGPSTALAPRHPAGTTLVADVDWDASSGTGDPVPSSDGFVSGDFDGDGRAEFATWALQGKCKQIRFETYVTDGSGAGPTPIPTAALAAGTTARCIHGTTDVRAFAADLTGDGADDLIVALGTELRRYDADRSGRFRVGAVTPWSDSTGGCVVADVDGDGRQDLVCERGDTREVVTRRAGPAGWTVTTAPTTGAGSAWLPDHVGLELAARDVDGDGLDDVILARRNGGQTRVVLGRARGDGTYDWTESQTFGLTGALAVADVDGDGQADLVFVRAGAFDVALARKGAVATRWQLVPTRSTPLADLAFADVDGDGRADLLGTSATAGRRLALQRATGQGTFGAVEDQGVACEPASTSRYVLTPGDWNGDGLADPTCVQLLGDGAYTVVERAAQPQGVERMRWRRADLDGDGTDELLYATFDNPGYTIHVVSPRLDQRYATTIPVAAAPFSEPDANRWVVADVGSLAGPADGKIDLVMVEHVAGRLVVSTLYSTGLGTFSPVFRRDVGAALGRSATGWFPVTADRDGRAAVARIIPVAGTAPGVRLEILRPSGPGAWARTSRTVFGTGSVAPMLDHAARGFRAADLDGDGLTDFVHVDSGSAGNLVFRSLRADGSGGFVEAVASLTTTLVGPRAIRVADLDGDGAADLLHVARTDAYAPCLIITQLAGDGRGGFAVGPLSGTTCVPVPTDPLMARVFEDAAGIVAADLDGDGRDELVHLTHASDAGGQPHLLVLRLRREVGPGPTNWRLTTYQPALAYDLGDAWSWTPSADAATGTAQLAYVHPQGSVLYRYRRVRDEVIATSSGTGAATAVTYGALPTAGRGQLPAGYIPRVVTRVESRDLAASPQILTTTTYGYLGARWSDQHRQVIGYETTSAHDGTQVRIARFTVGEACGGQEVQTEVRDPAGALWSYTATSYVAAGAAAPYRCLIDHTAELQCERTASCRTTVARQLAYDLYGNVSSVLTSIDQGTPTAEVTFTIPNPTDYIVARPTRLTTYDAATGQTLARTTLYYDGAVVPAAPTRGALTAVAVWDDQTGADAVTTNRYDSRGNRTATVSPEGRLHQVTWDAAAQRYPEYACDALHCVHTTWDPVLGLPTAVTDANLLTTTTSYDALGRTVQVAYPDGGVVRTRYLAVGAFTGPIAGRQRIRTERDDGSADGELWSEAFFDGTGRVWRTTREGGATVTTRYADLSDRPAATSLVHDAAVSPSEWIVRAYDGVGRATALMHADGQLRMTAYGIGRRTETDELGIATTTELDGRGHRIRVTDAAHGVTTYRYDAAGRLVDIVDPAGNLNRVTWSSRGLAVATADPDRGTRTYTYTPDGQLEGTRDAKGQTVDVKYDVLGRALTRELVDANGGRRVIGYRYDDGGEPHGASRGRLVRVTDAQATPAVVVTDEQWYDPMGRTAQRRRCIGAACMTEATTFDVAGRPGVQHYPDAAGQLGTADAEDVPYTYDDAGRLVSVGGYGTLAYNLDDTIDNVTYGNGVETTWAYDALRGWVDSITVTSTGGQIAKLAYSHDPSGRIVLQQGADELAGELGYTYDPLGRLTGVASPDLARREGFTYDAIGRMTWQTNLGDYRYDDPAHVHAVTMTDRGAVREHDANGNVTFLRDPAGRKLALAWSSDDKLVQIDDLGSGVTVTMAYDVGGARVRRDDGRTVVSYFGPRVELDSDGHFTKTYLAGAQVIARAADGRVAYFHQDVRHDVRLVTGPRGSVLEHHEYGAFGAPAAGTAGGTDVAFASARTDAALGLVTMGARTYDPTTAQFLSADSIIPDPARPQSLHRYSYVENDPIDFHDPSGHMRLQIELRKLRLEEGALDLVSPDQYLIRFAEQFSMLTFGKGDLGWDWAPLGFKLDDNGGHFVFEMRYRAYSQAVARPRDEPHQAAQAQPEPAGSHVPVAAQGGVAAPAAGGCASGMVPACRLVNDLVIGANRDDATDVNDAVTGALSGEIGLLFAGAAAFAHAMTVAAETQFTSQASTWLWYQLAQTYEGLTVVSVPSLTAGAAPTVTASVATAVAEAGHVIGAFAVGFIAGTYTFRGVEYANSLTWNHPWVGDVVRLTGLSSVTLYRQAPAPLLDWYYQTFDRH